MIVMLRTFVFRNIFYRFSHARQSQRSRSTILQTPIGALSSTRWQSASAQAGSSASGLPFTFMTYNVLADALVRIYSNIMLNILLLCNIRFAPRALTY